MHYTAPPITANTVMPYYVVDPTAIAMLNNGVSFVDVGSLNRAPSNVAFAVVSIPHVHDYS